MNYNDRLQELKNQIVHKRKLQSVIEKTKQDLENCIKKEEKLKRVMISEQNDVDKILNGSFLNSIRFVFGNKEEALAKEEKEARVAYLKHEECLNKLNDLNNQYATYVEEYNQYGNIEEEYIELLKQKKQYLKYNSEVKDQIIEMEEEIISLKSENKEIEEAINAGNKVTRNIKKVQGTLNSAESWSTFDILGGGTFVSLAKHSSLDTAKEQIALLHRNLDKFKYELNDVTKVNNIHIELNGMLSLADIFFDNILLDFLVADKINETIRQVNNASIEVNNALSHLKNLKDNNDTRIKVITQDLQDLVVNTLK